MPFSESLGYNDHNGLALDITNLVFNQRRRTNSTATQSPSWLPDQSTRIINAITSLLSTLQLSLVTGICFDVSACRSFRLFAYHDIAELCVQCSAGGDS